MQRFTYTLLIFAAILTYTSCVSDNTQETSTQVPTTPEVVKKENPKPIETPSVVQEVPKPTPAPPVVQTPVPTPPKTVKPPVPAKPVASQVKKPTPPVVSSPMTKEYIPPAPVVKSKPYVPPTPISAGKVVFENPTLNYGYIKQGDVINHEFKYTNTGSIPVNILNAEASCGCTRPQYSFLAINPGETGEIRVEFDSKGKLGRMESKITLLTDANPAKHTLYLVGTITDGPKKKEEEKEDTEKDEEKEDTAKEKGEKGDEKEKDTEETQTKSGDKESEDTEANEDAPKKGLKDRLPFRGRKLPKGIAPKKQGDEEGNGGSF